MFQTIVRDMVQWVSLGMVDQGSESRYNDGSPLSVVACTLNHDLVAQNDPKESRKLYCFGWVNPMDLLSVIYGVKLV